MDDATKQRLRKACTTMLKANDYKLTSVKAQSAVHSFWHGALVALNETHPDAHVTICLLTARYEDLCDKPTTKEKV